MLKRTIEITMVAKIYLMIVDRARLGYTTRLSRGRVEVSDMFQDGD